jgi:hypothetical protein
MDKASFISKPDSLNQLAYGNRIAYFDIAVKMWYDKEYDCKVQTNNFNYNMRQS